MYDTLWLNAHLATMRAGSVPYGAVTDGAIAISAGKIAWAGSRTDLPGAPEKVAATVLDAEGAWITPGLVDCHTHLVYGGNRANEFEMRLGGATYEDIARAGGGIVSTVNGARALGMGATHGTIEVGKVADLAFWKVDLPGELAYAMGANPCVRVVRAEV